jgi:hypothetical protein
VDRWGDIGRVFVTGLAWREAVQSTNGGVLGSERFCVVSAGSFGFLGEVRGRLPSAASTFTLSPTLKGEGL